LKTVKAEKEVLSCLDHPNIIGLFCTYVDDEYLYFVLEFAPGGDLFGHLKKYGAFNHASTVFYSAELISALEYMHGKGVLHRDLKPENLIFDENNHLKVTDFGTAKMKNDNGEILSVDKKKLGTFVGTSNYISPELILTQESTEASDLWAVGCIIYQMATAQVAFTGLSDYLIFQKVKTRDVEFPKDMHEDVKDIVDKLLQLDPNKRLGMGSGGYKELKEHPFFRGVDWDNISLMKPPSVIDPKLKADIDAKLLQEKRSQEKEQQQKLARLKGSELSPLGGWDDDENDEEILLMKKQKQQQQVKGFAKQNSNQNLKSSTTTDNGGGKSISKVGQMGNPELTKEWADFLCKGEQVIYTSPIIKRTAMGLNSRKRQLMLTTLPRFLYIDGSTLDLKGTIPWEDDIMVMPNTNNVKKFAIKTKNRVYDMEDLAATGEEWMNFVDSLKAALIDDKKR